MFDKILDYTSVRLARRASKSSMAGFISEPGIEKIAVQKIFVE